MGYNETPTRKGTTMHIVTNVVGIALYPVLKRALDPKPKKTSKSMKKFEEEVAAYKATDPAIHYYNVNKNLSTLLPYV